MYAVVRVGAADQPAGAGRLEASRARSTPSRLDSVPPVVTSASGVPARRVARGLRSSRPRDPCLRGRRRRGPGPRSPSTGSARRRPGRRRRPRPAAGSADGRRSAGPPDRRRPRPGRTPVRAGRRGRRAPARAGRGCRGRRPVLPRRAGPPPGKGPHRAAAPSARAVNTVSTRGRRARGPPEPPASRVGSWGGEAGMGEPFRRGRMSGHKLRATRTVDPTECHSSPVRVTRGAFLPANFAGRWGGRRDCGECAAATGDGAITNRRNERRKNFVSRHKAITENHRCSEMVETRTRHAVEEFRDTSRRGPGGPLPAGRGRAAVSSWTAPAGRGAGHPSRRSVCGGGRRGGPRAVPPPRGSAWPAR